MCSEKDKERQGTAPGPLKMALSGSPSETETRSLSLVFRKGSEEASSRKEKAHLERTRGGAKDEKNGTDYPRLCRSTRSWLCVLFRSRNLPLPFFLRSLEPLRSRSRSRKSGSLCLRLHVLIQTGLRTVLQVARAPHSHHTAPQHSPPPSPVTVTVSSHPHPSNGDASERSLCCRRKKSGVKNGPIRVIDRVRCAHQYLAVKQHFQ